VGQDVAPEAEPDGVGQRKLEEVDDIGIRLLRALVVDDNDDANDF